MNKLFLTSIKQNDVSKQVAWTLNWIPRLLLASTLLIGYGWAGATAKVPAATNSRATLIKNATIWTVGVKGVLEKSDLLFRDGKILLTGPNLTAPPGSIIIEAAGKHITPGLIDCHSHSAIRGEVNEGSNNVTAEVRVDDVIDPQDINVYRQLAGGLTAAHLLHGSANAIGGQTAVVKLKRDSTREGMLISSAPKGIKFALGENPKRSNFAQPGRDQRYPATRVGVGESIRERFMAAHDYSREWDEYNRLGSKEKLRREPPRRDLQLEAIAEILIGKRRIHSHSYRQDEILALIRLASEFGFRIGTFQHVLEGYKVADEIADHGAGASTFSDWWAYKLEAYDAIPYNGTIMKKRGVNVSFNSDSGELARRLNLEAAKAVKYGGLSETEALKFVTLNPAQQMGIDSRVGSLEPEKDADFVVWSGHPLSVYSIAEQTWVEGAKQFDRNEDLASRQKLIEERARLIENIKRGDNKGEAPQQKESPTADEASKPSGTAAGQEAKLAASVASPKPTEPKTKSKSQISVRSAPEYRDRLSALAGTFAIVGATVHTITHGTLENGTVVFDRGKITAVGTGVPVPEMATVIEGKGLHVYPGLIAANSALGLTEINSVSGSVDTDEIGPLNPNIHTEIAVNPDSELIPVTRANGVTHALTVPSGGSVSGTSALIRLDGWTWEDLTAGAPVAMHLQWPDFRTVRRGRFSRNLLSEEEQRKVREKTLKDIREAFENARAYQKAKAANGKNGARHVKADPIWEAMLPVLEGKIPVIVHASEIRQIKSAVEWADEAGIRIIILGAGDVWRVAGLLKEKGIPVVIAGVLSVPERIDEPYDTAYAIAAQLSGAGVKYCIATPGGRFDAPNTRNLPYHAGMAASFGLSRDEALKAITLYPAQILGFESSLGSIDVGKSASLILTDGDPLEIRTRVVKEFIDGRPVALENNKHYRLFEKYVNRPRINGDPSRAAQLK